MKQTNKPTNRSKLLEGDVSIAVLIHDGERVLDEIFWQIRPLRLLHHHEKLVELDLAVT